MFEPYNCRVYSYESGQHVTFYSRIISPRSVSPTDVSDVPDIPGCSGDMDIHEHSEEMASHSSRTSCSRSKNTVYRIARSNEWDWFITLTFDRSRTDASDYDIIVDRLHIFLNNLQKRKCSGMKYLIVPELHADKTHYHFHGLLAGVDNLRFSYSGRDDKKSGRCIYNIPEWTWGFTTATRIGDSARASSYITKYITKDVDTHLKNKRRFYYSRTCNIAEEEHYWLDEDSFLQIYADRITYTKSVFIPEAGMNVNYYEISY